MNEPITIHLLSGRTLRLAALLESKAGRRLEFQVCACKASASTFHVEFNDEAE